MISMLTQHLPHAATERQGHARGGQVVPNTAASVAQRMEDLTLIFLPFLSSPSQLKVWNFFLSTPFGTNEQKGALQCDEAGVRKRAWRILGRCLELGQQASEKLQLDEKTIVTVVKIEESGGAKRVR
jgi:hypothetical protein